MKKLLCLLLTMICILLTGCGNGQVASELEILVNEAGSAENTSEMTETAENMSEETAEPEEAVPETKYIFIDLLEVEKIHTEGDAVEPWKLKILSEEKMVLIGQMIGMKIRICRFR